MKFSTIFIIGILLFGIIPSSMATNQDDVVKSSAITSVGKYVIFSLDDGAKSQFDYARPLFNKYGFKATFNIVCNWIGGPERMSWKNVTALQNDGMEIESHSMTHAHLGSLSAKQLDFEIGGSQACLKQHGFNATVFAYPGGDGSQNSTVVNIVSKYYDFARTSNDQEDLWFLDCNNYPAHRQVDCNTYANGKLQFANKYDIRMRSFDNEARKQNYNDTATYNVVVNEWLKPQMQYNVNGAILSIPVINMHQIDPGSTPTTWLHTNQVFLNKVLKYLHDNGYQVIMFRDLGYDSNSNTMYIKEHSAPNLNGTIITLNKISWPAAGNNITVKGKLTDNLGNGLGGKTILFTGTGGTALPSIITKSDGTFSFIGKSPSTVGVNWQVNSIFTGDASYAANSVTQFYNTL